ncbi:hypothetical protein F5B19DRAFT_480199 [Rostrohypoxylon terebratum]|nr:hypothetical protein F5B19DRAFT_480199 [Rostrohypoxylon terebratum]
MDNIITQSKFPEHILFKALKSHQSRLRKILRYQPIPSNSDDWSSAITRIALKQLEQVLRTTLAIEIEIDDLKLTEMLDLNKLLQSLCSLLESVVNIDLLCLNGGNWAPCHNKYPKLMTLVNVLSSQNWEFDLIAGTEVGSKTLFKVNSDDLVAKIDAAANEFNTSVQNSYLSPLQETEPTTNISQDVGDIEKAREFVGRSKVSLKTLLESLSKPTKCQGAHQLMVQLADSSVESRIDLHLFMSRCSSNVWLETQLESLPSGDNQDWEIHDDVCAMVQESDIDRGILFLATKDQDDDLYLFNPISSRTRSPSYPSKKPTTTLSDLLDHHAFHEGPRNIWIKTKNPFCEQEKRSLAAKLVLGLGYMWGSGYILKSWSPDGVYFLTDVNGVCLRDTPYALCVLEDKETLGESSPFSSEQILAKVLMEIEYGSMKKISSPAELQIAINECLTDDLRRQDYIAEVQNLLNFHRDAKKLSRRINALYSDYSTIARMIIARRLADRIRDTPRITKGKNISSCKYDTLSTSPSGIPHSDRDSSCPHKGSQDSAQWFQGLSKLSHALEMKGYKHDDIAPKIKIAILDTGLDEKYRNNHSRERYNDFVSPAETSYHDPVGHGTQMYQVLRRVYSEAEIYIGRVFETCQATAETADLMTEAIDYAVRCWDVDIIAMPSGFDSDHRGMLKKIIRSTGNEKSVLFFAAAANYSNMKRVAFPARLHRRLKVISMFSTTAKNKPTPDFHPAPDKECRFNLAIFGEHVFVNQTRMSGTSVSTMIGAGLAGRLLAFSHHPNNSNKISHVEDLRAIEGMSAVLKSMAIEENGYDCILPEKLLDGCYDRDVEDHPERLIDYVCSRIGNALDTINY